MLIVSLFNTNFLVFQTCFILQLSSLYVCRSLDRKCPSFPTWQISPLRCSTELAPKWHLSAPLAWVWVLPLWNHSTLHTPLCSPRTLCYTRQLLKWAYWGQDQCWTQRNTLKCLLNECPGSLDQEIYLFNFIKRRFHLICSPLEFFCKYQALLPSQCSRTAQQLLWKCTTPVAIKRGSSGWLKMQED